MGKPFVDLNEHYPPDANNMQTIAVSTLLAGGLLTSVSMITAFTSYHNLSLQSSHLCPSIVISATVTGFCALDCQLKRYTWNVLSRRLRSTCCNTSLSANTEASSVKRRFCTLFLPLDIPPQPYSVPIYVEKQNVSSLPLTLRRPLISYLDLHSIVLIQAFHQRSKIRSNSHLLQHHP